MFLCCRGAIYFCAFKLALSLHRSIAEQEAQGQGQEDEGQGKTEEALAELRVKRSALAETLSGLEVEIREVLLELLAEFDRRYSDIAEANRSHYTTFFATVSFLHHPHPHHYPYHHRHDIACLQLSFEDLARCIQRKSTVCGHAGAVRYGLL